MLVLGRKSGESVMVGHDIEIRVLEIRGGRVKLGFQAPAYVSISRSELLQNEGELLLACEEPAWS